MGFQKSGQAPMYSLHRHGFSGGSDILKLEGCDLTVATLIVVRVAPVHLFNSLLFPRA